MSFESFVALRYLQTTRKKGFLSLISIISVAGVAVGVMALIVVIAVMTGFSDEFRDKILGVNSAIVIQQFSGQINDYEQVITTVLEHEEVTGATPYIYGQAMITTSKGGSGCVVRGIDPESADSVLALSSQFTKGSMAGLEAQPAGEPAGIILGTGLARKLRVGPGDRLRLMSPAGPLTPMGIIPRFKTCQVQGLFATGMHEYDNNLAYVSLSTAQNFFGVKGAAHGIELAVIDIDNTPAIARDLRESLGTGFLIKDWMEMNFNLFSALKLEKTAMFIILTLIVLVAAFNIISTLIMVVMEKTKDIAILKAMGATNRQVTRIFIIEGLVIGISGTVLGLAGGLGLCSLLKRYNFIQLPSDVYPMSTLPVTVLPMDITMIAGAAIIITFLATLYPSWQAARVEPAESLRY
ncbi:MAG: lipoprotein-releasing ABC transporter permease subunit [Thermodesulfobacteriota bacterium]